MTARECGEAASGVAWSVLEEDRVLGLGAEVRHLQAERVADECELHSEERSVCKRNID